MQVCTARCIQVGVPVCGDLLALFPCPHVSDVMGRKTVERL